MSEEIIAQIERRKNHKGVACVAPFIDGWNVWDIPEKEWTEAVEKAVLHAYELGWRHCNSRHANMSDVYMPEKFPVVKAAP